MIQKIIKVGNSLAVTIPKQFIDEKQWKAGKKVYVEADLEKENIVIHENIHSPNPTITPEFKEWLDKFNKKYKKALTELAKK